jgi:hypothetical protein
VILACPLQRSDSRPGSSYPILPMGKMKGRRVWGDIETDQPRLLLPVEMSAIIHGTQSLLQRCSTIIAAYCTTSSQRDAD